MNLLSLDLSKPSAGWARWDSTLQVPECDVWKLGDEASTPGVVFARLHTRLNELYNQSSFTHVVCERPLYLDAFSSKGSADAHFLLVGLAAHVSSFCAVKKLPQPHFVRAATWRSHFLGAVKRGTKSPQLKQWTLDRCFQLGMKPQKHDAADACGILDYELHLCHIMPTWRKTRILTTTL